MHCIYKELHNIKRKFNTFMKKQDFDFDLNRGNSVKITLEDNSVRVGELLGIMPDDMVVIEFNPKNYKSSAVLGLAEIDYSEIKDVEIVEN